MKSFLWVAGAAVGVLLAAGCGRGDEKPAATSASASAASAPVVLPVLRKAPEWVLKDADGRELKGADFKGKVVVVDFWATWCAPCLREMPEYVAWQKKYAERGLVILGFSMDHDTTPAELKQFGERMKINYPLVPADGDVASAFGEFEFIPTAFLIDREGNIRHMKTGPADMAAFEAMVESLL